MRNLRGNKKKGRKCQYKCKQMFNSTHHMLWNTDIPQLFCQPAMKFPLTIIYTFIFVHTPPRSCKSSLIGLLKSFRDIPGDYKHAFHIFGKGKQWKGAIRMELSAGWGGDVGELSKNQQKRKKIKSGSDKGWKTFGQRMEASNNRDMNVSSVPETLPHRRLISVPVE